MSMTEDEMLKWAREAAAQIAEKQGLPFLAREIRNGTADDMVDITLSAIRLYEERRPKSWRVKKLEWQGGEPACAKTPFGQYLVQSDHWGHHEDHGAEIGAWLHDDTWDDWDDTTAKAAAQADYEARIRAAIEEVPAEPDAALRAENEPDPDILREDRDERLRLEKEYPDDAW